MTTPQQRTWLIIQKNLGGVKIQPHVRRSIEDRYGDLLDVLSVELPKYLSQFKDSTGSAASLYSLAQLIRDGKWNTPEPEPEPTQYDAEPDYAPGELVAMPFIDDPLVKEMPVLMQALIAARLQGTGICVDYGIAGALAVMAGAVGNRVRFTTWGDSVHYPNLYIVLVGETGRSYKSSVGKWVKALLSDADSSILAADEGSVEALIQDLAAKPSRLWIRDEFAGLLAAIKGTDYLKPVRELLLSLYDHVGVYRRRLARASYEASNPCLSLLTTIQPAVMGEELFQGRNIDSGFVNRLLLITGDGAPVWPKIEGYQLYKQRILGRLRNMASQPAVSVSAEDVLDIAQQWEGREEETFGPYGKWLATRASIQALKIAVLLETADAWPGGKRLSPDWMHVSIALLERWYKADAAMIAEVHIKQPGERDRRDFYMAACRHSHNGTGPVPVGVLAGELQISKRQADSYTDDLVDRGWLRLNDLQDPVCQKATTLCSDK